MKASFEIAEHGQPSVNGLPETRLSRQKGFYGQSEFRERTKSLTFAIVSPLMVLMEIVTCLLSGGTCALFAQTLGSLPFSI